MSFENNPADDRYQLDQCIDEIKSLQSQVTTLAAERDEARSELEDAQRQEIETIAAVINHRKLIDEQKQKIDFLAAELAALKSAPGMEEVDALVAREDVLSAKMSAGHFLLFINACDLARRSIASREEVVGLLKWIRTLDEVRRILEAISKLPDNGGYLAARRILEIVKGNYAD